MLIDAIDNKKNSLLIHGDMWLKEGECLNIYGDADCGKTTMCFEIVKNNPNKLCLYADTEPLTPHYRETLNKLAKKVYITNATKLQNITGYIMKLPVDFVVIDSVTALQYITDKKIIEDFFKAVEMKKINAILVSQLREYQNKEYFENEKVLNFYSYRLKVEKKDKDFVFNGNKIETISIWNYSLQKKSNE